MWVQQGARARGGEFDPVPYSLAVEHEKRLIVRTVWGVYDDAEAIGSMREFTQLDGKQEYDELHDLSGVTSYEVTTSTVRSMAVVSASQEDDAFQTKRVAIVTSEAAAYGMARLYAGYHGDSKETMEFFDSTEAALAWISSDRDASDP